MVTAMHEDPMAEEHRMSRDPRRRRVVILRAVGTLCVALGAMVVPASAGADDVVATLSRDTPIAAFGGVVAWSDYDAPTARYQLVIRRGDRARRAPIAGATQPFDVSLGPDARGRVVALYTRCRRAATARRRATGCDVYRYDVRSGRERKLTALSSPRMDEAWPVQWRDRVAFVRRAKTYVVSGYDHRPDPRGKRGKGVLMDCDIPYVIALSAHRASRRLDRGQCGATTGMSIRGQSIVQVSSEDQGGAGSEAQVRRLRASGGAARLLARAGGGEGGYSPFASPSQSASAVYLTRTGNRRPMNFLRIDLASARLTEVVPHVPLAGRVARDERGSFWYVQAPEPPEEGGGTCERPFPTRQSPLLQPCRLIRASADPFSSTPRTLAPRLTLTSDRIHGLFTDHLAVSGDLTREVVSRSTVVRREPLPGVVLELLRNRSALGNGPFDTTGATTSTDAAGHWSFPLSQPPSQAYLAVVARALGLASRSAELQAQATVTLTASGAALGGTVTPAQPGRSVVIQRLDAAATANGPAVWTTKATTTLSPDGTTFSATVAEPGTYHAILQPADPPDPAVYYGISPQVAVGGSASRAGGRSGSVQATSARTALDS
jgi:hypothetical protein